MKILVLLSLLIVSLNSWALGLSSMKVYGVSQIKKENTDMWDKKNHAIKNAKEKATFKLAARVLKPEVFEEMKERLKKEIVPYSGRYLISSEVKSHGLEEEGAYRAYHAQVEFQYSLENFKNLLKNKGFSVSDLQKHKVAAFIEVLDVTSVKSYSWWKDQNPRLHPILAPLQAKLAASLKSQGYELAPLSIFRTQKGFKNMSKAMGAQYYVSGKIRIEKSERGFKIKEGFFNFHEALSQKLVSKVDLKKFGSALRKKREFASLEKNIGEQDLLDHAFVEAAQKMSSSEDAESLTQGLARISFSGVESPMQRNNIRTAILNNLKSDVASLTERRVEKGRVVFLARTQLNPQQLLRLMNSNQAGLGSYRGVMREDGKTLAFSLTQY